MDSYSRLQELMKRVATLGTVEGVLEWDHRTKMPAAAAEHRSEQLSLLAGLRHEWATDPEVGKLLGELMSAGFPEGSDEWVNLREWRREYDRLTKLPREFVEEFTRVRTQAQDAWIEARAQRDFKRFLPWLERIIDLCRRQADLLGWRDEPYDALLDEYEPGASTAEVARVLADLRDALVPMLRVITASPRKPDTSILHGRFPAEAQEKFASEVASAIGYDFSRGRLDTTTHPFCIGLGPQDTRITTRYQEDFLPAALFGVIHEAGHAIYDQQLPREHWGTPRGEAVSLGIHESQSRLWENLVGRSQAFWKFWYPRLQQYFPDFKGVPLERFYFAVNAVKPSFIRVEADEVTYNLHILLRFELERAMISGDLKPADLPGAWNERFSAYFGLTVPDDAQGCMQDIHWSAGLVGYFPTYTLGNLNAAQFFAKARRDLGDLEGALAAGNFAPLRLWLTDHIHAQGRRYRSAELTRVVTGKPLAADDLVDYLKAKFGPLYGVTL